MDCLSKSIDEDDPGKCVVAPSTTISALCSGNEAGATRENLGKVSRFLDSQLAIPVAVETR